MSLLWRKALGDARARPLQLGILALILAVGAAVTIAATNARTILEREIATSYDRALSPDLALWLDRVSPEAIAEAAGFDGVASAEGRRVVIARVIAGHGEWLPMRVTVLPDIGAQQLARVHQHGPAGNVDLRREGLWIEQSGRSLLNAGDSPLRVRMPSGTTVSMALAGFVHDPAVAPSTQERAIYAYATPATAARLGGPVDADQLWVRLTQRFDGAYARDVGERLRDRLVGRGINVLRVEPLPTTHPHTLLMTAVLRVLTVVSVMSLACTGALAAYLTSSWIRRERRVVGILRAMGARLHQVALAYLPLMVFALLWVGLVGVYAGSRLARALARVNAASFNIDVTDWSAGGVRFAGTLGAMGVVIVLGIGWPILRACMMPVREALADPGITPPPSRQRLGRGLRVPGRVSRTYALRNVLRRPWRLALVTTTLAVGGAVFLASRNNYESLMGAIDHGLAAQGHDIDVLLSQPASPAELEAVARAVPGVGTAEAWRRAPVRMGTAGAPQPLLETSEPVVLLGYPPGTRLFSLPLVAGRAPAANARDELIVTRMILDIRPGIHLGSMLALDFRGRRSASRIVGVVDQIGAAALYAPYAGYEAATAQASANALRVKVAGADIHAVSEALDRRLLDAKMPATQLIDRALVRDAFDEHFSVVGSVLRIVALAAASLGLLLLGGGASFDVFERRREIGVLRSLGATRRAIVDSFLVEGSIVLGFSAVLAVGLSLVLTVLALEAASRILLHVPIPLRVSASGCAILGVGALLAAGAVRLAVSAAFRESITDATRLER